MSLKLNEFFIGGEYQVHAKKNDLSLSCIQYIFFNFLFTIYVQATVEITENT